VSRNPVRRDRVVAILRDCGSLELGSNPGPGLEDQKMMKIKDLALIF
jgi:hypothetical protein